MGWLRGSSSRWRLLLGGLAVLLIGMLAAVLFTTFDTVVAGKADCGSPIAPAAGAPDGCDAELGHARATRTALLAWSIPCLAAMWFVEARGRSVARRSTADDPSPLPFTPGNADAPAAQRPASFTTASGLWGDPGLTTTYPRARGHGLLMQGMTALFAVIGLVVAVGFLLGRLAGDPMPPIGVVLFMAVWIAGTWTFAFSEFLLQPVAFITSPTSLRFETRWRPTDVPWIDLIEVRSSATDPNRQTAVWHWAGGKRRTWTAYEGWHRLLSEVEQRAPHASITGF